MYLAQTLCQIRTTAGQGRTYVSGIDIALDDIQYRDVARRLARHGRHHAVLRLEETPHDVQDSRSSYWLRFVDLVTREGCVGGHEEVAAWCRDERRDDPDEVIIHVAWVS